MDSVQQKTSGAHSGSLQAYMDGTLGFRPIHPDRTDEYVRYSARYQVRKRLAKISKRLESVVDGTLPEVDMREPELPDEDLKDAEAERGVAAGEDISAVVDRIIVCENPWLLPVPYRVLLGCEAQLVRAMMSEPDGIARMYILTLWAFVCSAMGVPNQIREVLARADVVGDVFSSVRCDQLYSLEEYYTAHRRLHTQANTAWDAVMFAVFRTRSRMIAPRDLLLCMWHPAYSCTRILSKGNGWLLKGAEEGSAEAAEARGQVWDAVQCKGRLESDVGADMRGDLLSVLATECTVHRICSSGMNSPA